MKILLIDNQALFREGLRHILRQLPGGADEILEAGNIPDGLKLARQHTGLGLVLLGLNSPESDGAIVVKHFCQRYPHIPLVVVSGKEDSSSVIVEALGYGASGFVGKSSSEATLLDAIGIVLSGGIYAPQQKNPQRQPPFERQRIRLERAPDASGRRVQRQGHCQSDR
jgi:DNA-binding NarL/FixJ family response regulator